MEWFLVLILMGPMGPMVVTPDPDAGEQISYLKFETCLEVAKKINAKGLDEDPRAALCATKGEEPEGMETITI